MSNSYSLSGCNANSSLKLNWLNYLKDNLYFLNTTRLGKPWGNCCYIGINNPGPNPVDLGVSGDTVYISKYDINVDDYKFEYIASNEHWALLSSKSANFKKLSDLQLDNYKIYNAVGASVDIREVVSSDNYKILDVYLKPQGVFGKTFENLSFIISTNNEIKVMGITNNDIEKIDSGLLDLNGVVYDLSNSINEIIIEGLKFTNILDLGSSKALVFEFPISGEVKRVYMTTESTSKLQYLIIPDANIGNLNYSFSNDELPPPISDFLINDGFVFDTMFYSSFEKSLALHRNKISDIWFSRSNNGYTSTQIESDLLVNTFRTQDFEEACLKKCDSLMLNFTIPRLECIKKIDSLDDVTIKTEGSIYICNLGFEELGHENEIIVYGAGETFNYYLPFEGMAIYNTDGNAVKSWLTYSSASGWVVTAEDSNIDYYRQLSIVNINNSVYSLVYLANLPKFKVTETGIEVQIII